MYSRGFTPPQHTHTHARTHTTEFNTKQNEYLTKKKTMWRKRETKTFFFTTEKKQEMPNWSNLKYPEIDSPIYNVYANIIKLKFLEGVIDEFFFIDRTAHSMNCVSAMLAHLGFTPNSPLIEIESKRCYCTASYKSVHANIFKYGMNVGGSKSTHRTLSMCVCVVAVMNCCTKHNGHLMAHTHSNQQKKKNESRKLEQSLGVCWTKKTYK